MTIEQLEIKAPAPASWQWDGGRESVSEEQLSLIRQAVLYLFYGEKGACSLQEGSLVCRTDEGKRYKIARQGDSLAQVLDMATGAEEWVKAPGLSFFGVPCDVFARYTLFVQRERDAYYGQRATEEARCLSRFGREDIDADRARAALDAVCTQIFGKGEGGALEALREKKAALQNERNEALAQEASRLQEENQVLRLKRKAEEAAADYERFSRLVSDFRDAEIIRELDLLHEEEKKAEEKAEELRLCIKEHTYEGFCPDAGYLIDLIADKNQLDKASAAHKAAEAAAKEVRAMPPVATEEEKNILLLVQKAGMEKALESSAFLLKRQKKQTALGIVLSVFAALLVSFSIGFFTRGEGVLAFLSLLGFLVLAGGAVAVGFEIYKAMRQRQALFGFCLADSAEGLALRVREAKDIAARIQRRRDKTFAVEDALCRTAEDLKRALLAFSETAAKYGYAAFSQPYETLFVSISADVDEYLKRVSALQAEKDLLDGKVRNMRKKLEGVGELSVRSRISPPDRLRLERLKEEDLVQGAAHYQKQLQELQEKEKKLQIARYENGAERKAAECEREIRELTEKETRLTERAEAALDALSALSAWEAPTLDLRENAYQTEEERALALRLSLLSPVFKEAPPLFFSCKDGAYERTAALWGQRGQAFLAE
ncbi:MAG: hypothetical protein J6K61_05420 [Clostridia bacterium]|nr:hypothetical protein [Clostridia bacterium]